MKKSFCDAPFKVADITEGKRQRALHLMLMSSSPGMLDNDEYNVRIHLGEKTSLALHTQSYQRIFQMKDGVTQTTYVTLEKGASLHYLPHPVVPHKDSKFTARNRIYLTDGCSLLWGEVINCGRKLNNEIFQFSRYHSLTEIFLNQKLVVKENLFLQPATMNLPRLGHMEGYTHCATLLYLNKHIISDDLTQKISNDLLNEKEISIGISSLPVSGIVVRLLGHKAEQLFALLKRITTIIESTDTVVPTRVLHV